MNLVSLNCEKLLWRGKTPKNVLKRQRLRCWSVFSISLLFLFVPYLVYSLVLNVLFDNDWGIFFLIVFIAISALSFSGLIFILTQKVFSLIDLKKNEYFLFQTFLLIIRKVQGFGINKMITYKLAHQNIEVVKIIKLKKSLAHIEFISEYISENIQEVYYNNKGKSDDENPLSESEGNPPPMQDWNRIIFYYIELDENLLNILNNLYPNRVYIKKYNEFTLNDRYEIWKRKNLGYFRTNRKPSIIY